MIPVLLAPVLDVVGKVLERIWPDPQERAKAELAVLQLQQAGELHDLEVRMSAIVAEAQSADPWTSRARPSFLWCVYIIILWAIPMGILSAIRPEMAEAIQRGMHQWWAAIPSEFWTTFTIGYTGYTVARSAWDKRSAGK